MTRLTLRLFAGACALIAFAPAAQAQSSTDTVRSTSNFRTGEQMYALCTASDQAKIRECETFLKGAEESIIYFQDIGETERAICMPTGITAATLREVAVAYWRDKPENRRYSAVSSYWNALSTRYPGPCGGSTR